VRSIRGLTLNHGSNLITRHPDRERSHQSCGFILGRSLITMTTQEGPPNLVIDRASSARHLTGDEIRAWGSQRSVFVSSVMAEFQEERSALSAMIEDNIGAEAILFERFGGRDENAQQAYLDGVNRTDVYVGVIGDRYGTMTATGRSATHEEYREASRLGKRVSVWVKADGSKRQGDARDFVEEVRLFHTTGSFTNQDELVRGVHSRLVEIAGDDLAPWVKLGPVVFRARRIEETEQAFLLEATLRDPEVEAALLDLRPPRRDSSIQFTDPRDRAVIPLP